MEYDLTPLTFYNWVKQARTTNSFKTINNFTDEQWEFITHRKGNKELKMQIDILKQATVMLAKRRKITANKDDTAFLPCVDS